MNGAQREHRAIVAALREDDREAVTARSEEHMQTTLAAWREVADRDPPTD